MLARREDTRHIHSSKGRVHGSGIALVTRIRVLLGTPERDHRNPRYGSFSSHANTKCLSYDSDLTFAVKVLQISKGVATPAPWSQENAREHCRRTSARAGVGYTAALFTGGAQVTLDLGGGSEVTML
jgi:hypothetical protein